MGNRKIDLGKAVTRAYFPGFSHIPVQSSVLPFRKGDQSRRRGIIQWKASGPRDERREYLKKDDKCVVIPPVRSDMKLEKQEGDPHQSAGLTASAVEI